MVESATKGYPQIFDKTLSSYPTISTTSSIGATRFLLFLLPVKDPFKSNCTPLIAHLQIRGMHKIFITLLQHVPVSVRSDEARENAEFVGQCEVPAANPQDYYDDDWCKWYQIQMLEVENFHCFSPYSSNYKEPLSSPNYREARFGLTTSNYKDG